MNATAALDSVVLAYQPVDRLYLWSLLEPGRPAAVGELNLVRSSDMCELFRRMVFNILIDNTDDHEKNHALIMSQRRQYECAAQIERPFLRDQREEAGR